MYSRSFKESSNNCDLYRVHKQVSAAEDRHVNHSISLASLGVQLTLLKYHNKIYLEREWNLKLYSYVPEASVIEPYIILAHILEHHMEKTLNKNSIIINCELI